MAADNANLHNAVFHITSLSFNNKKVFDIDPSVYKSLTDNQRIYVAYKICGFIYAMEPLQLLILSLNKSIDSSPDVLKAKLSFLLKDYLIYNYRTTLKKIKKCLEEPSLGSFAKSLFTEAVEYYDHYFEELESIKIIKELKAPGKDVLLKNFYQRRQYAAIPKRAMENSIVGRLSKSIIVNANSWALKRKTETKHQQAPLVACFF